MPSVPPVNPPPLVSRVDDATLKSGSKSSLVPEIRSVRREFQSFDEIALNDCDRGYFRTRTPEVDFDWYFSKGEQSRLFVFLCGAADRSKYTPPVFARWNWGPLFPGSIVSIADPSLELRPDLSIGWYIGTRQVDFTEKLASLISSIAKSLSVPPSSIIFYSSSSGAFASLMASYYLDDPICIVINPQIDLSKYYPRLTDALAQVFDPGRSFQEAYKDCPERFSVYSQFKSISRLPRIVYAQNIQDGFHFDRFYAPFCEWTSSPSKGGVHAGIRTVPFDAAGGHGVEPRALIKQLIEEAMSMESLGRV